MQGSEPGMELGQKLSICRGQWGRHLSLGLPHSFYFSLCLSFSFPAFQCFLFSPFSVSFACSVPVIEQSLCASIFSLHPSLSVQSVLPCFYISLPLDILSLSLCATPHPNSLPWISLASFHAFSYIICVSTSLLLSLPLARSLSWALCRFTHSCTISLCSNMFWSICSPTSRIG